MTSESANTPSLDATPFPPPSKPIEVLPTQPSQFYAHLQPVLLLSLLLVNFRPLVAEPVGTLLALAPLTALLQAVYCVLCLPVNGPPAQSGKASKSGPKKKSGKAGQQDIGSRLVPAILSFFLTLTLSTPVLYIALVLFGAPLASHHAHTLLLALHLALLSTPHLYYVYGLDAAMWRDIASLRLTVDEVCGMSLGACVGAWVGAVPIPLDWDREWQKWPVTVVAGLYVGAVLGKVLGGYVFRGRRIEMK